MADNQGNQTDVQGTANPAPQTETQPLEEDLLIANLLHITPVQARQTRLLIGLTQAPPQAPQPERESKPLNVPMRDLELFDGRAENANKWLDQVYLRFEVNPHLFGRWNPMREIYKPDNRSIVRHALSNLQGSKDAGVINFAQLKYEHYRKAG